MILAGDVGGTNLRLALFDLADGRLLLREEARYPSREFRGLEEGVARFLRGRGRPSAAGFGVAGPVRKGRAEATNLPWVIDAAALAARVSLPRVALLNDLVAKGLGLAELTPEDFATVNRGEEDAEGNRALIAAGTGLGEAFLVRDGGGWRALPSEGGHASFAPQGPMEVELLGWLKERHPHVSFERILSGPGLAGLYRFLRARSRIPEPAWLSAAIGESGDPAPAVSAAALAGRDAVAEETLEAWISIYGAEAGNLTLKVMATSGLFVGGGIAPKILPKLLSGGFFAAFRDKGRLAPLLSKVPVKVVLNDDCTLRGAARAAVSAPPGGTEAA